MYEWQNEWSNQYINGLNKWSNQNINDKKNDPTLV